MSLLKSKADRVIVIRCTPPLPTPSPPHPKLSQLDVAYLMDSQYDEEYTVQSDEADLLPVNDVLGASIC